MAQTAADLLVVIDASTEKLRRELKKSEAAVEHTAKKINRSLDAANDSFHGFESTVAAVSGRVTAALAGIGVAAAAAAVVVSAAFTKLEDLQDLKRTAQGLGITTTKLQELNYTFAQFGIDAGQVPEVFSQISAQAREALTGSDSMIRAFRDLGISVDDLRGKSPAQVLKLMADGAKNTGDDVQRLGALSTLLGDDLAKLLGPLLVQGAAAFDKFTDKAHEAGFILEDGLIDSADKAAQSIRDLKAQASALYTTEVAQLADEFGELAVAISDALKAFDDSALKSFIDGVLLRLLVITTTIVQNFADMVRLIDKITSGDFGGALDTVGAIEGRSAKALYKVITGEDVEKSVGDYIASQLGLHEPTAQTAQTTLLAPMTVTATRLPPQGSAPHEFRPMDGFLGAVDKSIGDKMLSATKELTDQFTLLEQVGQRAGRGIASGFADAIVEGKNLGDVFKSLAEDITKMILKQLIFNAIKQGLSGTSFGAAMGFADGGAFNQSGLIPFAKGGIVNSPTLFKFAKGTGLMGEAGPEAILPLERGPGGKLGVRGGGGSDVIVNVTNTSGQAKASASSRRGPDGQQMIDIMVEDSFNRLLGSGQLDQSLAANMGVRRPGRF